VVNAPFRVYWAYNPSILNTNLATPQAVDQSYFPNAATYQNYLSTYPLLIPYSEKHSMFRFSIGRTF
jgi:outer membrane protein insertion porin family